VTKKIIQLPGINPEPWAIGPLGYRHVNGKIRPYVGPNAKLKSFQDEVKKDLEFQLSKDDETPYESDCTLRFFFWRRLDSWETQGGRKANAHVADATNLQKALEDALQGVLISNDRNVRQITSEIVEQGPNVNPGIIIIFDKIYEPQIDEELGPYLLINFEKDRNSASYTGLDNSYE
jgi:Holliday junction resolvase RusA-like endonuclease